MQAKVGCRCDVPTIALRTEDVPGTSVKMVVCDKGPRKRAFVMRAFDIRQTLATMA